ncbi:pyruvate dehydrogenase (acetyl-transferring) E1 component subunit alpha [Leifsonia sp. NPDC080035]|uniref:Pyruvate dehydrogenase (Acetyl-transferring) E1 component subunit alpha n=1 Tax=Leifsonia sp. NPDC080035 TaxID=3143936 RepID=A0AAU7GH91_9MICO
MRLDDVRLNDLHLAAGADTVQLLTENGDRLSDVRFDAWVSDIGPEQLLGLYEDMLVIRRIDSEATALQRQGELGLWPPLLGQEASQIGSGRALRSDDFVFSSYREHGVAYCRGAGLVDLLRVWRGTTQSGWNPYDINMATPQVIIGAQTLHATGYALGIQADGTDAVAVAYFGDGATSEGDVTEAMIFAATYAAPVIFFCQNNQYAISEPVGLQAQRPIAERAPGFGIPSVRVDGNDVLAVMAVMRSALDRARSGGGPTFIEAVTYRVGPHTTADDPSRYRDPAEVEAWRGKDPVSRVEAHLGALGMLTQERLTRIQEKADRVAAEMRSGIVALQDPEPLSVFDNVYAEPHTGLTRQRDHYSRYLRTFVGGDDR